MLIAANGELILANSVLKEQILIVYTDISLLKLTLNMKTDLK